MLIIHPSGGRIRLVIDEHGLVGKELAPGEAPPDPNDTVFLCTPWDFDDTYAMPIGQNREGEGRQRWMAFIRERGAKKIVGWENVVAWVDGSDPPRYLPVEFDPEYLTNGVINPGVVGAILIHLMNRHGAGRGNGHGAALGPSGTSRPPRPASGRATAAPGPAAHALNSEPRPA
jgi:hypothetical protein